MKNIVSVELKEGGRLYNFINNFENIDVNSQVIVETEKGIAYGVVKKIKSVSESKEENKMSNVIRIASKDDVYQHQKNVLEARRALHKAMSLSKSLGLEMDFIDSNYNFDRTQLIFFFTSDSRVDFRELAKSLASIYRTRIELRQIGIRDKAKEISGIGICGRKLCCSCFLNDLDSVSISMAKNQNLALNPSKINGACGRLLCCLNYEDEVYYENRKTLPEIGKTVKTKQGEGRVVSCDILNQKYTILTKNEDYIEICVKNDDRCDRCENKKNCKK